MNFNLPKSFETIRTPFVIPSNYKKLGIIADLHIPYQNNPAVSIALETLLKEKIDCILINGDLMDFYFQSKFEHDPRKRSTKEELDITREFLDILNKIFPDAGKYFKTGNHEIRLEKYLMHKAPELLGINEFHLEILLKLGEKKIGYIDDKTRVKAGGLTIWHGHEHRINSSIVNPARSLFLKSGITSLMSHLHIPSQHNWKRGDDHIIGCWSTGHLGEMSPDYAVENGWIHGFGIVDINGKEFEVSNYKILKGKAYRT